MKKITSIFLTLLILCTTCIVVSAEEGIFNDVPYGRWYSDAIEYARDNGIMAGIGNNRFSPDSAITRAQFAQILSNLSGNEVAETQHFVDVKPDDWYFNSVEWVAKYGIAAGVGGYKFEPNQNITREQLATMLYRYFQKTDNVSAEGHPNYIVAYADVNEISKYAEDAMAWCVANKVLSGRGNYRLCPKGTATRAEAAQIFYNLKDLLISKEVSGTVDLPIPDELTKKFLSMSLEEKVGQMFMPRYNNNSETLKYYPAGYVLFAKDFAGKSKSEVKSMISKIQSNSNTPLFISVDEEGGTVNRVSLNSRLVPQPYKSIQDIYKSSGIAGIISNTTDKCNVLKDLGINANLAPVCDITSNPSSYIYPRTVGQDAKTTSSVISSIVTEMNNCGISSSLKHFPGYGSSLDTHKGMSVDNRQYSSFETSDFLPFKAGIESGADSVMVSHNIVTCMDNINPSSLSPNVHKILRENLGFDGVIMTDDLSMQAIKDFCNGNSPAVKAVLAGNDILLTSDFERDYKAVLSAVKSGQIKESNINESVKRVLQWKQNKGLIKE